MGIQEDILSFTKRQERLDLHSIRLAESQKRFISDIRLLGQRITQGETTGNPVLDYVILYVSANQSLDTSFIDKLNEKNRSLQEKLSKFPSNEVCILDNEFVVQLDDPTYVVTPDKRKIHFKAVKSFKIIETQMEGLELKVHSLEPCKSEEIGSRWSNSVEYVSCYYKGWDEINKRFLLGNNPNPLLLKTIYGKFDKEIDDELRVKAEKYYSGIAQKVVLKIDSLSKSQKELWDKIEARRRKLEDLKEKAEGAKGKIVLSIQDQLDKDNAEIDYEMEFLRGMGNGDQRRKHEWQLRRIEMCLEEAITLGMDDYEKDVTIEVMPGEYRVFNVARYIKTLCNYMEIVRNKPTAKV
ncbi:hypothetical protein HYX17_02730 [Candidatus Woesearchaeota archaeon]|nr:hypothetical protein [Candidatus Woesearchaeota archaeon]